MQENPEASEDEQELAQTDWMDEDEEHAPADDADDELEDESDPE